MSSMDDYLSLQPDSLYIEGKRAVDMSNPILKSILDADKKKKRYTLLITGSSLRPSGGGQPGDRGELRGDGFLFEVLDTSKHEEGVAVSGTLSKGTPVPGMSLEEIVDLELRAVYSRMHTGEHILSRVLEREPSLQVLKVAVAEDESVVYLKYPGELRWDNLFEAEAEANSIVGRDLPVDVLLLDRKEAKDLPGIRGKWGRITDNVIRVIRIEGFDTIACSGSHVASTGEVGDILVTGFKGPAPDWEIRYVTRGENLRNQLSQVARRLARDASCPPDRLEGVFAGLRNDNSSMSKALGRAANMLSIPWESGSVCGTTIFTSVIPGLPKEVVSHSARKWSDEHPDSLVLLLLPEVDGEGGAFLLYRGTAVERDFSKFLRSSPSLSAKGGGRADWLNGFSSCMKISEWLYAIERFM